MTMNDDSATDDVTELEGFGEARYGNTEGVTYFKLKENSSVSYRILPPMHSFAKSGKWGLYEGTHYGYAGVNTRDPSKPRQIPFRCIREKNRDGLVLVECPECNNIEQHKLSKEEAIREYTAEHRSKAEIDELTAPLDAWLKNHRCDQKWRIPVMNKEGEFGILLLSHRTKKTHENAMVKVKGKKIDPQALNQGAWFRFTRTGTGFTTPDEVEVETETVHVNGGEYEQIKKVPLTKSQAMHALERCPDLNTLQRRISAEQIQMLVDCSGDPEEIDAIFAMSQPAGMKEQAATTKPQPSVKKAPAPVATRAPLAPPPDHDVSVATAAAGPSSDEDEEAALMRRLELARARKAAAAATSPVTATAAVVSMAAASAPAKMPMDMKSMSDEEFLKRFKKPGN